MTSRPSQFSELKRLNRGAVKSKHQRQKCQTIACCYDLSCELSISVPVVSQQKYVVSNLCFNI